MAKRFSSFCFLALIASLLLILAMSQILAADPVRLRIMLPAGTIDDPATDPVMQEIQKRTNTKVEFVTGGWDQIWNKVNLAVASKEDIDLIHVDSVSNPWQQWAREGLFYCLDDLVTKDKYPYIESVSNSWSFAGLKVGGKRYFLPGTHHGQDWAVFIREDWLLKLGLAKPKTMDEMYTVLKAFRDKDPDGNGKNDTIPWQVSMPDVDNFGDFEFFIRGFGGSPGGFFADFELKNGKLTDPSVSNNTRDGLKFVNKLYREGLINKDFASLKDVTQANAKYLYADKAGCIWTSRTAEFEDEMLKTNPDARLGFLAPVAAKGRKFYPCQGTAWWLLLGIPKTCKNPQKALEFVEFCNSEEGRKLLVAGVKGRHYSEFSADGVFKQDREAWVKDYDPKINGYDYPLWWRFFCTVHGYIPVTQYGTYEEALKHVQMYLSDSDAKKRFNWKTMVKYGGYYNEPGDPLHAVTLDSVADITVRLQKNVKAVYWLKIITAKDAGEIDKLWQQYRAEYKKVGGDKFIAAYQDYYDKNLKK